jgi:hypothetical protein
MTAYRGELVAGVADEHAGLAHRAVPHRDALYELGHAHLLRFFFFFLPAGSYSCTERSKEKERRQANGGNGLAPCLLKEPLPAGSYVVQNGARRRNRDKQMEATVSCPAFLKNPPLAGVSTTASYSREVRCKCDARGAARSRAGRSRRFCSPQCRRADSSGL